MVKTLELANGNYIGMGIVEVVSVPYYMLLDKDIDRANFKNQVLFTQIISSFYRKAGKELTSIELMYQSFYVDNQTYKAQVKIYFIIRNIEPNVVTAKNCVEEMVESLIHDLEDRNYVVKKFQEESEYDEFQSNLNEINTTKVYSIGKQEKVISNAMSPNGMMYYNPVIEPSENVNNPQIINALTQAPNSVFVLQLIPTSYSQLELMAIEESKNQLNYYVREVKYNQGMPIDNSVQSALDGYNYYSDANNEQLFNYNCLVFSDDNNVINIANKIIDSIEEEGKTTASQMIVTDVTNFGLCLSTQVFATPWMFSNTLIEKARETNFWGRVDAPIPLIRLKQLMTTNEVKSVFKIPMDDERVIGIDSIKVLANRGKLHKSIISEGNFKIGKMKNTVSEGGKGNIHVGIDLNEFTKHGLVVGMPGSGKTNFSLGLLLQFWNDFKIPFLAIEPTKTEYRSLIDDISDLQVFTPGKNNVSPFIINPFLPPKGVTVESYVPSLMSAFEVAFSLPDPLPEIFKGAVNACYNEYGWRLDSTVDDEMAQPFGMYEFIKVFKRRISRSDYKGDIKSNLESAGVVRLVSLIEQNSNIYDTIHTIPLEDLLEKPTVIELNAISNSEQKSLIMALLLILICSYTKNNVLGDGVLKNVMLIDEAHVLLDQGKSSNPNDSGSSTVKALEDMIAEIRSYGTSIIIADQSPTRVGKNIVAYTNVKVIFRLVEKESKDSISTATNMSDAHYDLLGRLGVGEAMVHYTKVDEPLFVMTYNVKDRADIRQVINDDEISKLSKYWEAHEDLLIPHKECVYNDSCDTHCSYNVRINADFIATRLINEDLYSLQTKEEFLIYLSKMKVQINRLLQEYPKIVISGKMYNCIKIKFLRKAMLIKSFDISKHEYQNLLKHKNFLEVTKLD